MAKQLRTSVNVDGIWYRPGFRAGEQVPDDVAAKITNPKAWEYTEGDESPADTTGDQRTVGVRLARTVDVDGTTYGPGDTLTEDVARRITNPKAWEDGRVPDFDAAPASPAKDPDGDPTAPATDADPAGDASDGAEDGTSRPARRGRRASA